MPELIPAARKSGRCSVDHVDSSRAAASASDGLTRDADREIGLCRLAEIRGGERVAELVALRGGTRDAGRVLMPELVPRRSKTRGCAVDDVYGPCIDYGTDVFDRNANRQIRLRAFAEVCRGQHFSKTIG